VPQLEDLSRVLRATTGFTIRPVAGLVGAGMRLPPCLLLL
jgi:phenylalanine-4-hydroxylase